MSVAFKQAIENIKELSSDEKVLVAHCLISSLESKQDEGVDEAWAKIVEKRYLELESGAVRGVSWEEIKNKVRSTKTHRTTGVITLFLILPQIRIRAQ